LIILGVDPGTIITGFGVVEALNGKLRALEYNVVKNKSSKSMPIRLRQIYAVLCDVIDRHHPDEFAIETAFYGKNAQSALKIGHARGVSILAAVNHEIPTTEYSPREVKKAVTGNGAASKEQVEFMVKAILKLREVPKFYDASDALAVAICHFHKAKTKRNGSATAKTWKAFAQLHSERIVTHT
jgi:crossover junction endodeoxyribonuclease RuvC